MDDPQTQLQFGRYGAVVIEGGETTDEAEGSFSCFQCLSDAEIEELDAINLSGESLLGRTLDKNTTIFIPFRQIKVTSGLVIAYKSKA